MALVTGKDSMRASWPSAKREKWGLQHWAIHLLRIQPIPPHEGVPVHTLTDKIPLISHLSVHRWVLFYSALPLLVHQLWLCCTGHETLGKLRALGLYSAFFHIFVLREMQIIRWLGKLYDFLDGTHARDGVTDAGVTKVFTARNKTAVCRIGIAVWFAYDPHQTPARVLFSSHNGAWWWLMLPLKSGLYGLVLDFWFYWYHRAMHEVGFLWKYHRTHHLTKRPNALLTAYTDEEQELLDLAGIPLVTYLSLRHLFPLAGVCAPDFYQLWLAHKCAAFTETFGHSGIRVHVTSPTTLGRLLRRCDAEITGEDHDLHHRAGWRGKGFNYGKQAMLWDRLFGTRGDRIETAERNVDYGDQGHFPII